MIREGSHLLHFFTTKAPPGRSPFHSLGPPTPLHRLGPLEYLLSLGRGETGGKWEGEWWFRQGVISRFPRRTLPWRQFQRSAWSKEARFGLCFPGSAERDPHFAGNRVSSLSNTILNRLFSKIAIKIAQKNRGRIGFPAGRDSWGYIPLMERTDRCCMQSVNFFLLPGFEAVFIG